MCAGHYTPGACTSNSIPGRGSRADRKGVEKNGLGVFILLVGCPPIGGRKDSSRGVWGLSRVGFLQAQPYKWRRTKRLVTAQRRKFSAQARPDSSRSSPSTYHYLPRKNLPLKGVWGGSRRNAFLVVRLFGRLSHSAKTCPEKAAPSPWGFWRVDGEIGRQVAGGKGVADSGSLAKGGKTVGDLTPRPLPREPGLSVANAWAGGGGTSTSGGGLAAGGSIKLLLPGSPDQPQRARLKWFRGAPTSNDGDVSS
jgi:hypothetical protein